MLKVRTFVHECVDKNLAFITKMCAVLDKSQKRSLCDDTPAGQAFDVPYEEC